jgi:tripartite-type tricarboxylate transporter receptor subunit TctC
MLSIDRCMHAALVFAALVSGAPALAQSYPTRPITIVIPIGAGTGMDLLARVYGEKFSQRLGKPVIVENRPGAGLTLAPSTVASAPADGYTLMVAVTGTFATYPVLYKKLNYAPKDFTPIAMYVKSPFVLVVNPDLPARSALEFINLAKTKVPPLTYSTPGAGTMQHLAVEAMRGIFHFDLTQVPYRNTQQSVTDIVAGHVNSGVAEAGASIPLIKQDKLRALAVTSTTRFATLPDVPPFAEAAKAPGFEAVSWHALVAPCRHAARDRRAAARRDEADHGLTRDHRPDREARADPVPDAFDPRDAGLHQVRPGEVGRDRAGPRSRRNAMT